MLSSNWSNSCQPVITCPTTQESVVLVINTAWPCCQHFWCFHFNCGDYRISDALTRPAAVHAMKAALPEQDAERIQDVHQITREASDRFTQKVAGHIPSAEAFAVPRGQAVCLMLAAEAMAAGEEGDEGEAVMKVKFHVFD